VLRSEYRSQTAWIFQNQFPKVENSVSFAPLMMFVYRKVSGLRPVERHISATCSAACESRAAAHTDTCRRRRST